MNGEKGAESGKKHFAVLFLFKRFRDDLRHGAMLRACAYLSIILHTWAHMGIQKHIYTLCVHILLIL